VEGAVLLREAVAAGLEVECQFVAEHSSPIEVGGTVFHLAEGVMERVASTETPQPVIGIVRMPQFDRSIVDAADFVVVANGVADPGNLGTMLRSAEGSGADVFVVTPGTVDHTNPKVVRAAAGSLFRIPVLEIPNVDDLAARISSGSERRVMSLRAIPTSISHVALRWYSAMNLEVWTKTSRSMNGCRSPSLATSKV